MASLCGHPFRDPGLLGQVCTHVSANPFSHNASLANLGDLVLGLHVGSFLYKRFPCVGPGLLSMMKSINVDNERLARVCIDYGLDEVLHHNIPDYKAQVTRFKLEVKQFPRHSNGRIFPPKYLADMVEALIGAAWLELNRNMAATGALIDKLLGPLITDFLNFGHRPIHMLKTCKWRKDLKIEDDMTACVLFRCTIYYKKCIIARASYIGSEGGARNRTVVAAIEYFRSLPGFEI